MRNSKEIKKNPKEVEIVKQIFNLASEGKSGWLKARHLNEGGHRRRNGSSWTQRQVWAILSQEDLYRQGIIRYGEVKIQV